MDVSAQFFIHTELADGRRLILVVKRRRNVCFINVFHLKITAEKFYDLPRNKGGIIFSAEGNKTVFLHGRYRTALRP